VICVHPFKTTITGWSDRNYFCNAVDRKLGRWLQVEPFRQTTGLWQTDKLTDRQTDRNLTANTACIGVLRSSAERRQKRRRNISVWRTETPLNVVIRLACDLWVAFSGHWLAQGHRQATWRVNSRASLCLGMARRRPLSTGSRSCEPLWSHCYGLLLT